MGDPTVTDKTYLQEGYLDPQGRYRPAIYREEARFVVDRLVQDRTTMHAVRRFYNQVKALEARMDRGKAFDRWRSDLARLESHAVYAQSRGVVGRFFPEFIRRNVAWAERDWAQFEGFVRHFESVLAYWPATDETGRSARRS